MASIIPGYEYDIFISYRQKDNRSDQWVTNFVQALRDELDATFKEEISIYFDENPHDGLLETHDVDDSLKHKLKCGIFIPIISQTYCDTKCFAWQHEFIAFKEMASSDNFGIKIKLPNGNVASRILPISIHEIDQTDRGLLERELGGNIRGIEFIYKNAGVVRPLNANEDEPKSNLNRTYYRDQINKVARAIKELMDGLTAETLPGKATRDKIYQPKSKSVKVWMAYSAASVLVLALVAYAMFYFFFNEDVRTLTRDKSIAVLPFVNISNNPEQEYFSDGITEEIVNQLSKITDLRVTSRTSVMGYKGTTKNTRTIASELGVATLLEGSVRQAGDLLRISVNLIDCQTDQPIWTKVYDRKMENVFAIQSSIAQSVAEQLRIVIAPDVIQQIDKIPTSNLDAYNLYLEGVHLLWNTDLREPAKEKMSQAIALDSNFALAYSFLARMIMEQGFMGSADPAECRKKALPLLQRAMAINDQDFYTNIFMANYYWWYEWDFKKAEATILRAAKLNPSSVGVYPIYGNFYYALADYEKSARYSDICLKDNPTSPLSYQCSRAYIETGQIDRALEVTEKSMELFGPTDNTLIFAGYNFNSTGHYKRLVEVLEPVIEKSFPTGTHHMSSLAVAYFKLGRKGDAAKWLSRLTSEPEMPFRHGQNFYAARYYADVGEIDEAFMWLEKSFIRREPDITFLKGDSAFKSLHSDKRWQELLDRIGFP